MWHLLHLIAAPVGFLLGLFCILTGILLYPNEEGKIQSTLEDFWLRRAYLEDAALSKHATFMAGVARLETTFLDRVFGHKLLSGRTIGISLSISLASLSIFYMVSGIDELDLDNIPYEWMSTLIGSILLGYACIFLRKRSTFVTFVIAGVVCNVWWWIKWLWSALSEGDDPYLSLTFIVTAVVVVGSFVCDVIFIVITRRLLRLAGEMTRSWRIVLVVAIDFLLACCLIAGYFNHDSNHKPRFTGLLASILDNQFAYSISVTNFFDAALALLFVLLAVMLLLHRCIWPVLSRTVFKMQDIGTKGRRGILVTVGLAFLGWSGVQLPELLKKLIEKLGG
jgi:hypothetical protein